MVPMAMLLGTWQKRKLKLRENGYGRITGIHLGNPLACGFPSLDEAVTLAEVDSETEAAVLMRYHARPC